MGIFDIFGTGDQDAAAAAQKAGLTAGNTAATGNINSAIAGNNTSYAAALQPYLTNYGQANAGATAYGNAVGANGPAGNAAATAAFMNNPGYQFRLQQGNNAITAQNAATGKTGSGNELLDLSKFNQGLAGTSWDNYVSSLAPYLGQSNAAAGGIANVNMGQAGANSGQYDQMANLNYQTQTGIGNANANANLAGLTASGNSLNAIGSIGSTVASLAPFLLSDERVKEDIETVGKLYDGQPVYKYRYVGSPVFQLGLMAQDVEKIKPEAVIEIGGIKAVNYDKATEYASELARFLEAA